MFSLPSLRIFFAAAGWAAQRPGFWGLALAGLLAGPQAHAQDSTLTRLVQQHRFALTQTGTQFAGPGWDKLRQDVQKSQFVLVGEDHGTAQIPAFATALAQELKPAVYLTELDTYQAQDLNRLAAQPGLPTAYTRQHPMGLSFYSWQEEFALAQYLRRQHVPIVGIDQVSIVATGRFFTRLAGLVKSPTTRAYLRGRATAYQAQDRAAMQQGTNKFSVFQRPAALDSLRALTRLESPAVRQMVADFVLSSEIYQHNATGNGHQERVNALKRNLLLALAPYQPRLGQPLPKLLFKFGASHLGRTLSPFSGITDVGSLVQNLADAQDAKSLHLFVVGKQGTHNNKFDPTDFSKNAVPYSLVEEMPMLAPFFAQASGPAWQAVDLRPLRRAYLLEKLQVASPDLVALLLSYDYVVIIPETTASHNY